MSVKTTEELKKELADTLLKLRDIEESLGEKDSMARMQGLYKQTLEETHEGLQILDFHWRYVYLNSAAAAHGHTTIDDIIGKTIFDRYPGFEHTSVYQILKDVMHERKPRHIENQFTYPNGERCWFDLFVEPHPLGILIHSIDITQKKQIEEQYQQAQKMQSVGLLAGGVAHDFNNKLGVMTLFCELAIAKLGDDHPKVRDYLKNIFTAVHESAELTKRLLAFSRKQVLDLKSFSFNDLINELKVSLERTLGESIAINYFLDPELGNAMMDHSQTNQAILNLCLNARDAMPNGGVLTIETANVVLDKAYCSVNPQVVPGNYVMLSISDNGHGMTGETRSRIFEPFFTTKERGKGTGLGLSSVHGVINQSHGHIWVYSEPNVGTTFKIYVPQVMDQKHTPTPLDLSQAPGRGTETILVIEDDILLQNACSQALENYGYTVHVASNCDEALVQFHKYKDKIDLILTDVVLPKVNGREIIKKIRELGSDVKVIYMSGYTENSIVHNGILDTQSILLQKPVTTRKLYTTIRSVLEGKVVKGVY